MKKIIYLIVTVFMFSLFRSNVYASSFSLTLDGRETFANEFSFDIIVNNLNGFTNGFYGLDATFSYDHSKVELVSIEGASNTYDVTYDKNVSDRFVVLTGNGVPNGTTLATVTFRKKTMSAGNSVTVSLTNLIGSTGEADVKLNSPVSKTFTVSSTITAISADYESVDFGSMHAGFSATESDKVLKTVRITNTGNTTITLNNTNPAGSGPFGCYWFDSTAEIAPGEYMDVRLRLSESSAFANRPGSYSGTYVFTATNVSDAGDQATINITASATLTEPILKGDMNDNGRIDLNDIIVLLRKYLSGDATEEEILIGDMDESGSINLSDIIQLLRTYLMS